MVPRTHRELGDSQVDPQKAMQNAGHLGQWCSEPVSAGGRNRNLGRRLRYVRTIVKKQRKSIQNLIPALAVTVPPRGERRTRGLCLGNRKLELSRRAIRMDG